MTDNEHDPKSKEILVTDMRTIRILASIAGIVIFVVVMTFACGAEIICITRGGQPVSNFVGMEWCEMDGNNVPSFGDSELKIW